MRSLRRVSCLHCTECSSLSLIPRRAAGSSSGRVSSLLHSFGSSLSLAGREKLCCLAESTMLAGLTVFGWVFVKVTAAFFRFACQPNRYAPNTARHHTHTSYADRRQSIARPGKQCDSVKPSRRERATNQTSKRSILHAACVKGRSILHPACVVGVYLTRVTAPYRYVNVTASR